MINRSEDKIKQLFDILQLSKQQSANLLKYVQGIDKIQNEGSSTFIFYLNDKTTLDTIDFLLSLNNKYNESIFSFEINLEDKSCLKKLIIDLSDSYNLILFRDTICMQELNVDLTKDCLKIKYYDTNCLKQYIQIKKPLEDLLLKIYKKPILIDAIFSDEMQKIQDSQRKETIQIAKELRQNQKIHEDEKRLQSTSFKNKFKAYAYEEQNICAASLENPRAKITGTIFKIDINNKPRQKDIIKFGVSDNTGAIYLIKYSEKEETTSFVNDFKVGSYITANIEYKRDDYSINHEIVGTIRDIFLQKKPKTIDKYENKRVEFVVHSKMTTYDSIIEDNDLKQKLLDNGYTRFAITDRNNVQNFHQIEKVFLSTDIKPIYGIELEVLNRDNPAILNVKNQNLNDIYPLVIFDLETTGLYPNIHEIIEFGAVKINKDKSVERLDFFMKPKCRISEFTEQLTHISNEDLKDAISEYDGLLKIIDFCKNSTLIAHNGISFDFKFLQNKLSQYNLEQLDNQMIDTLIVSRTINKLQSNTLEKVCKFYKVEYNREEAHRADYDAEVLYRSWLKMVDQLNDMKINSTNELNNHILNNCNYSSNRGFIVNLYAKNQDGIKDLYELISIAHTKNFYSRPILFWDEINNKRDNLLIANNPIESDIINYLLTEQIDTIQECVKKYDFILVPSPEHFQHEITATNISRVEVQMMITKLINLAIQFKKIPVATSNCYYLEKNEEKYHRMFLKSFTLNKKLHRFAKYDIGPLCYYRTSQELINEFSFLDNKDLATKIVIDNSILIANQIDSTIQIAKQKLYPPIIPGVDDNVRKKVFENATKMYGNDLPIIVKEQIDKELNSIISNGYAVVYWVSSLLVEKSLQDGYLVGSRGSVGSSIVATFLNITDVNPLPPHYLCTNCKYSEFGHNEVDDGYDLVPINCPKCNALMYGEGHNIPFETFLGFKGDKVPDIDLNFSGVYQNKAHNFIREMFGEDKAFRAGTVSTIAQKSSFSFAREYFNRIGKEDTNFATIEEYAIRCENCKKTTGQHPGGIVVVPQNMSIFEFSPFNYPADDTEQDWKTTHFAFEYIHDNLLKFDILGHDNPTMLKILDDLTGIGYHQIPNHDDAVLKLFTSCAPLNLKKDQILNEPTGAISLPEFGTKFVREMLSDAQPTSFADLIRISGLSHGTDVWINNAASLIKDGKTLKEVIGCRDDIMIYLIKKGVEPSISFKVMEDVRKGKQIKPEYQEILRENNVPEWYIESANKIKYMFPKAHATAYVVHAWKFAWYKLYHPLEYYASYFTVRLNSFDVKTVSSPVSVIKQAIYEYDRRSKGNKNSDELSKKEKDLYALYEVVIEAKERGINIIGVDLNKSGATDFIIDKKANTIICPFVCIDGLGEIVANSIVEARENKSFSSVEDLMKRTKISKLNITTLRELNVLVDLNETDQISLF